MDTFLPIVFIPIPDTVFPSVSEYAGDINDKDSISKFEKELATLLLEFDLAQNSFIFQFQALLEQHWLISEPSDRDLFSFDLLFSQMCNRFDISDRIACIFSRIMSILRDLERGTNNDSADEMTLRLRGVEDEQILENIKSQLEKEKKEMREQTPLLTVLQVKRLSYFLFQLGTVMKRLVDRFPRAKEGIIKKHKVTIKHNLMDGCDDPILERLQIDLPMFAKAESVILSCMEECMKNVV